MALPAGRYGVTKNQLLKIKKLPMNTIKLIEELTEKFNLLGTAAFKDSTSVVTQSSDLVESGAVYDAIEDTTGWVGGNLLNYNATSGSNNGVSYTVNSDKTITANRTETSSNNSQFTVLNRNSDNYKLPTGRYVFSGCPSDGSANTYQMICQCTRNGSLYELGRDYGDGLVVDIYDTDVLQIVLLVNSAYNADNLKFEPMISRAKMPYRPHHASVEDSLEEKADNSVIAPIENGTNASQAYAVGQHFIRDGAFCTCIQAIAQGGTFTLNTNYTAGNVADCLIKWAEFTGTTSAAGNLTVDNVGNKIILSAYTTNATNTLAFPFKLDSPNRSYVQIRNRDTMAVVGETEFSIKYFYIEI